MPVINAESPRWDLRQIKAPEAWPVVSGGKDVVVAVLDTGIDAAHQDLKNKVIAKIINVSIVISKPYQLLEFAAYYAWKNGCIIVAAMDKTDLLAKWSNHGDWVDIAAQGVDINGDGQINDEVYDSILKNSDQLAALNYPERRINVYKAATGSVP